TTTMKAAVSLPHAAGRANTSGQSGVSSLARPHDVVDLVDGLGYPVDLPGVCAGGGEEEQDASRGGLAGGGFDGVGVGGHLRPVVVDSRSEGVDGYGVGLVVDNDQAVVVTVEQVDDAFEDPVADRGADVGFAPMWPGGGALDD